MKLIVQVTMTRECEIEVDDKTIEALGGTIEEWEKAERHIIDLIPPDNSDAWEGWKWGMTSITHPNGEALLDF